MEHLWAPWRMAYIEPQTPQPQGCIFCTLPAEHRDAENYILYRGTLCFMMLNRYPYNNGHLMIAPYQHVPSIEQLDAATLAELMAQAQLALRALRQVMNPDGFNMGINDGKVAGGSGAHHKPHPLRPPLCLVTNILSVNTDSQSFSLTVDECY